MAPVTAALSAQASHCGITAGSASVISAPSVGAVLSLPAPAVIGRSHSQTWAAVQRRPRRCRSQQYCSELFKAVDAEIGARSQVRSCYGARWRVRLRALASPAGTRAPDDGTPPPGPKPSCHTPCTTSTAAWMSTRPTLLVHQRPTHSASGTPSKHQNHDVEQLAMASDRQDPRRLTASAARSNCGRQTAGVQRGQTRALH